MECLKDRQRQTHRMDLIPIKLVEHPFTRQAGRFDEVRYIIRKLGSQAFQDWHQDAAERHSLCFLSLGIVQVLETDSRRVARNTVRYI